MGIASGRIERTDDGILAGVCDGLAESLDLDVGVLRFGFVALAVASLGIFAFAYVALWLVLPRGGAHEGPLEICLDSPTADDVSAQLSARRARRVRPEAANEPPTPPPAPGSVRQERDERSSFPGVIAVCLIVGIVVMVGAFCALISLFFPVFTIRQLWPLLVIAIGIVRMVVPGVEGYRLEAFCDGAVFIMAGAVLLLNTMGVACTDCVSWIKQGWPLLAISLGCVTLWRATRLNGFCVAALMLAALFCLAGVVFCSAAGPASPLLGVDPNAGMPLHFGK